MAGLNSSIWDSNDDAGNVVPNEAYTPVITAEFANKHWDSDVTVRIRTFVLEDCTM